MLFVVVPLVGALIWATSVLLSNEPDSIEIVETNAVLTDQKALDQLIEPTPTAIDGGDDQTIDSRPKSQRASTGRCGSTPIPSSDANSAEIDGSNGDSASASSGEESDTDPADLTDIAAPEPAPATASTPSATNRSVSPSPTQPAPRVRVHTTAPATPAAPAPAKIAAPGPASDGPWQIATAVPSTIYVYTQPLAVANPGQADRAFSNVSPFGGPMVFLVTAEAGEWLQVLLPVKPNHQLGWVQRSDVTVQSHHFHATIDLSDRSVAFYNGTQLISSTKAVVGKSATPTPLGRFYVNERIKRANPNGAYGPWILGLSGRSEALTSFGGGEPVIAIHGTNKPGLIGSAASNGCIRLPNDVITYLAQTVPLGTVIDVVA